MLNDRVKRVSFRDPVDEYADNKVTVQAPAALQLLSQIWLIPVKRTPQIPMHLLLTRSFEVKITPKAPTSSSFWKP